jgi:hypothetical protein
VAKLAIATDHAMQNFNDLHYSNVQKHIAFNLFTVYAGLLA